MVLEKTPTDFVNCMFYCYLYSFLLYQQLQIQLKPFSKCEYHYEFLCHLGHFSENKITPFHFHRAYVIVSSTTKVVQVAKNKSIIRKSVLFPLSCYQLTPEVLIIDSIPSVQTTRFLQILNLSIQTKCFLLFFFEHIFFGVQLNSILIFLTIFLFADLLPFWTYHYGSSFLRCSRCQFLFKIKHVSFSLNVFL